MKKILIIISLLLFPQITFGYQNNIDNLKITIKETTFSGLELQTILENLVDKTTNNDLEEKSIIYKKLLNKINILNKNDDTNLKYIKKIVNNSLDKTNLELEKEYKKIKKSFFDIQKID